MSKHLTCNLPPDLVMLSYSDSDKFWSFPASTWNAIERHATGKGITIANLDTGYNPNHPLLPKPVAAKSFVPSEPDVVDYHGHGSHTAGTCCGRDRRISCATDADLIVAKVLDTRGQGTTNGIAQGIRWAVQQGADIINMSLGGQYDAAVEDALIYASDRQVLCIAAAGNDFYRGIDNIGHPASSSHTLAIGNLQQDGRINSSSSGGRELDCACPGTDIISCSHRGSEFAKMTGTSMAAPHMTAVAAIVCQMVRKRGKVWLSLNDWRRLLDDVCKDIENRGRDPKSGRGVPMIDAIVRSIFNRELRFM